VFIFSKYKKLQDISCKLCVCVAYHREFFCLETAEQIVLKLFENVALYMQMLCTSICQNLFSLCNREGRYLFTSDKGGGGTCFCPCLSVCLSVYLSVSMITQKHVHGFGRNVAC